MNLNFLQKNNNLPGETPKERLGALVKKLNEDPEITFMEKAQINMGFSAISSILPEDPEEGKSEMLKLIRFIAGLFNYQVVLIKPEQDTQAGEYPVFEMVSPVEVLEVHETGVKIRYTNTDNTGFISNEEFETNFKPARKEGACNCCKCQQEEPRSGLQNS